MSLINLLTLGLFQTLIVRQGEVRVIERRGKYVRVAEPGVTVLLSLFGYGEVAGRFTISRVLKDPNGKTIIAQRGLVDVIPTRLQVDDYPQESVITRDNATVAIDAVVYYRVVDPAKAVYQVHDYVGALQKLVQSALRDECGKYELDELLVSRDKINNSLRIVLDEATDPWGIKVERVEIKDIDLGAFGQILAEQRAAETKRRTEITEAEGAKRSAILRAEGESESRILQAKANKEATVLDAEAAAAARILAADAEAQAIFKRHQAEARGYALIREVLGGDNDALLRAIQVEKAAEVSKTLADGKATKMVVPSDISSVFGLAKVLTD